MPKTQVNSATGIMGVTGSGKSSLAATLADYLWVNWRKVLLMYSSDGGGFPAEVQARIALGTIRVFRMRTRDLPHVPELAPETCYRACQMWWPKRIDPRTGEVEPGVEMIPPIAKRWEQYCKHGHLVKSVVAQSLLTPGPCPQCAVGDNLVTAQNMHVKEVMKANKGFENVGGVFYDGLSSMLSWILLEMGHRAGRMELKGEEGAIGGKVKSGDMTFGGVTRSHVGFAQNRGEELVNLTLGIPGLMVPPVFTMLTHEDVDDRALSIRGPKIAGRAKTDEAPQWFGNMLEAQKVEVGNQYTFSLRLSEYTDTFGVKHLCKHRGAPGTMPDELTDPVEGPPFSEFNLGNFFSKLDAALSNRINEVGAQFPDAPGLPDGIVEIGDRAIEKPVNQGQVTVAAAQVVTGPQPSTITEPGTPVPQAPSAPAQATKPTAAPATTTTTKKTTKKTAAAPPAAAPPVTAPVPAAVTPTAEAGPHPEAVTPPGTPEPAPVAEESPAAPAVQPAATVATPAAPAPAAVPSAAPAPVTAPTPPAPHPTNSGSVGATPAGAQAPRPAVAAPPPGRRPASAAPTPPAAAPRPPQAGAPAAPRPAVPPAPPTTT